MPSAIRPRSTARARASFPDVAPGLVCATCGSGFASESARLVCTCGGLLDVVLGPEASAPDLRERFERRRRAGEAGPEAASGVWRYRELVLPGSGPTVSHPEGNTPLYRRAAIEAWVGLDDLALKHEGENPSGSFKDRGMTVAVTQAVRRGATAVACASTGNTSASMAAYAAQAGLPALVFVPRGKVAAGKLAQALAYGARTLLVRGDFDACLRLARESADKLGVTLLNSVNPWRIEGQKTIVLEMLQQRDWEPPDWIVVPGGNLGNSSAFGKAFAELLELGLIERAPRLAVINAAGANTLYELFERRGLRWNGGEPDLEIVRKYYAELDAGGAKADTIASAIEINRPVNLLKCLRALDVCDGVVREVTDQEILDAKARVGSGGFGCEPASAASVAGAKLLREQGVIGADDRVVCILTGHQLKDPTATVAYHTTDQKLFNEVLGQRGVQRAAFANRAVAVPNNLDEIIKAIKLYS